MSSRRAPHGRAIFTPGLLLAALGAAGPTPSRAQAPSAPAAVEVTASADDGFSLRSPDGDFSLRLRGYLQLDGRLYTDGTEEPDTFTLRRARALVEGTLYERFGFRLMPDFGGGQTVVQDAYVDWTFSDALVLRAGKMKVPLALERQQGATETTFVERALPSTLVPIRDLGVLLRGRLAAGRLDYAVGLFHGALDGTSGDNEDDNDAKDVVARLWATPWQGTPSPLAGLSFGIGASQGDHQGSTADPGLGGYRSPGQLTFFAHRRDGTAEGTVVADGEHRRVAVQGAFYRGPLGLLGEHVTSRHQVRRGGLARALEHEAWQLTGVWVLTGEDAAIGWHTPARGFDPRPGDAARRGWGALALTVRYHAFTADAASFPAWVADDSSQEARAWAVGLDWTLQGQIRLLLDYEVTTFDGLGDRRSDERALFTRLQLGW
jgi:phosphate-selective porin OprO/OprP